MKILKVTAKNFLSWAEFKYSFGNEVIAITGENKTQDDQGSNGSGKSSIQQIIFYSIVGSNTRDVLDKKLIQYGYESSSLCIQIECPVRHETLDIKRKISLKGSSQLSIEKNGVPVEFATVNDGNKYIISWIGILPEDLKSYFIICKESYKSFFKASNTEKMNLISRFINFSYLDKTKDVIDQELETLSSKKQSLEREKSVLEGKMQVYEESLIQEEMRDFDKEKEKRITVIEKSIEDYNSQIEHVKEEIKESNLKIAEYQEALSVYKLSLNKVCKEMKEAPSTEELDVVIQDTLSELAKLNEDQSKYLSQQDKIFKELGILKSELQQINVNLSGKIKCPSCGHEFITLRLTTLEKEEAKKKSVQTKLNIATKEMEEVEKSLKDFEDIISEAISIKNDVIEERDALVTKCQDISNRFNEIERKISRCKSEIENTQSYQTLKIDTIKNKKAQIESLYKQISSIKSEKCEKDTAEIENNISVTAELIRLKNAEIANKDQEMFEKSSWINRFKDFKRYLAVEQLNNIQSRVNDLLKRQKSDLRLLLEGFKVNASGKTKEEITPLILREEPESFWYYSGGERARVELATIMAFQTLINSTNPYGGLDFLFIDEVLEGLSEEGLYNIMDSLQFASYPILIITHVSNQSVKCKALKVEKENGISKLI